MAVKQPRLTLQILNEDDHLLEYHGLMSDPSTAEWSSHPPTTSLEVTRAFLREKGPPPRKPWKYFKTIPLRLLKRLTLGLNNGHVYW
ncbi:hypothetical protein G7Y89_g9719 [Cudoniella acicularis]|uniref:Uncharacterized protein n=1 Tax=Cudoniella acicularis TaxID=354080 RepID=A0A8H4VZR4_9HELO|nr:hypothetical protein G7Y89_g9719 [Cudoniella acicularis]